MDESSIITHFLLEKVDRHPRRLIFGELFVPQMGLFCYRCITKFIIIDCFVIIQHNHVGIIQVFERFFQRSIVVLAATFKGVWTAARHIQYVETSVSYRIIFSVQRCLII